MTDWLKIAFAPISAVFQPYYSAGKLLNQAFGGSGGNNDIFDQLRDSTGTEIAPPIAALSFVAPGAQLPNGNYAPGPVQLQQLPNGNYAPGPVQLQLPFLNPYLAPAVDRIIQNALPDWLKWAAAGLAAVVVLK